MSENERALASELNEFERNEWDLRNEWTISFDVARWGRNNLEWGRWQHLLYYLCYCSCACFLGYLVNQLFYIFEHLFILVEDQLVKILSFCVFLSPGDVAFLFFKKRNLVWATSLGALPSVPRGAAIFSTEDSLPIRWFEFVNSYYSSTQVRFSSQKVSTLSGHSQLICWRCGGSLGSNQTTDTGCFLNGLHLAVTSDVPVILPLLLETSLVPWCQADSALCVWLL